MLLIIRKAFQAFAFTEVASTNLMNICCAYDTRSIFEIVNFTAVSLIQSDI